MEHTGDKQRTSVGDSSVLPKDKCSQQWMDDRRSQGALQVLRDIGGL